MRRGAPRHLLAASAPEIKMRMNGIFTITQLPNATQCKDVTVIWFVQYAAVTVSNPFPQ